MPEFTIDNILYFKLEHIPSNNYKKFAYGSVLFKILDKPIWYAGSYNNPKAVKWTWNDLLLFLTRNWAWLFTEQVLPGNIPADNIPTYWWNRYGAEKDNLYRNYEDILEADKSNIRAFYMRHNITEGVPGIDLPPVFILRTGNECLVSSSRTQVIVKIDDIYKVLSAVGDEIASWITLENNDYGKTLVDSWNNREEKMRENVSKNFFALANMTHDVACYLSNNDNDFWNLTWDGPILKDNEIFAAARMSSGYATPEEQMLILQLIKREPKRNISDLEHATSFLNWFNQGNQPHVQGYAIARKFREYLNISHLTPIDPQAIFERWNIAICEVNMDNSPIEAIACWGDSHGPLTILNIANNKKCSHINGRNFTLAHEICHLLVDRGRGLGVGEVLGGATLKFFEKRANAFAAEILLPNELVFSLLQDTDLGIEDFIDELRGRYNVTKENIAGQILNHERCRYLLNNYAYSYLNAIYTGDNDTLE